MSILVDKKFGSADISLALLVVDDTARIQGNVQAIFVRRHAECGANPEMIEYVTLTGCVE